MSLNVHRKVDLFRQPPPPVDQRNAFADRPRPHVGLQVDVVHAELDGVFQHRLEVVDRAREALALDAESVIRSHLGQPLDGRAVRVVRADAVETCFGDHLHVLFQRALAAVGMPSLHRPQRLVHHKGLAH